MLFKTGNAQVAEEVRICHMVLTPVLDEILSNLGQTDKVGQQNNATRDFTNSCR